MKKFLKIIGCIFGVLIIIVAFFAIQTGSKGSKIKKELEQNGPIDMSIVEDGTYKSSKDAGLVKVTVEVTVKDHEITDINLIEHQNGKGKPAEAIIDVMLANNTDDVDTVSGATMSSVAIKAAVNDALNQGISK